MFWRPKVLQYQAFYKQHTFTKHWSNQYMSSFTFYQLQKELYFTAQVTETHTATIGAVSHKADTSWKTHRLLHWTEKGTWKVSEGPLHNNKHKYPYWPFNPAKLIQGTEPYNLLSHSSRKSSHCHNTFKKHQHSLRSNLNTGFSFPAS